MPPRAMIPRAMDYMRIVFGEGTKGEAQRIKYVKLFNREVTPTSYQIPVGYQRTTCTVKFRMFNKNYKFSQDRLADLLQFSHGVGLACEGPLEWDLELVAFLFW
ncbi:hypothetical protein KIW84_041149 [Lathyrus oleraceus]|uniref:Uncharacterized protein n=1 Tax=Pisum sativum TaxID=3888 RepID=A0A9D4XAR7_PEA|nr:hypothetical protein KIW84_041149 [Pisum sativum]